MATNKNFVKNAVTWDSPTEYLHAQQKIKATK